MSKACGSLTKVLRYIDQYSKQQSTELHSPQSCSTLATEALTGDIVYVLQPTRTSINKFPITQSQVIGSEPKLTTHDPHCCSATCPASKQRKKAPNVPSSCGPIPFATKQTLNPPAVKQKQTRPVQSSLWRWHHHETKAVTASLPPHDCTSS